MDYEISSTSSLKWFRYKLYWLEIAMLKALKYQ